MLKRLLNILSGGSSANSLSAQIIPPKQHAIVPEALPGAAKKVVQGLSEAGYQAFLVGGCVRDLLLDLQPKDFDVATDATPEQVRKVFRNSRIIGRRFRIVHVRFGREVIEVTTFRSDHVDARKAKDAAQNADGMLLRDNVYGDIESDALRRDFTVNAFYYNLASNEIVDYTGGMADLQERTLRMIGDPATRYKEDPVRVLRAVRFAGKLGFNLDASTAAPVAESAQLLDNIPSARLWDECLKIFMSGYSTAVYRQLLEFDVFKHLFPGSAEMLAQTEFAGEFFEAAMSNTDKRIRSSKRVTPAFIFAVLLWPEIEHRRRELASGDLTAAQAAMEAQKQVLARQIQRVSIPKRFSMTMRDIWSLQSALPRRSGRRAYRTLEHPKFRAGYDFLLLREQAGEDHNGLGQWWTDFQSADETKREEMVQAVAPPKSGRRPRRRNRGKTKSASSDSSS
jgi:poly(A) polymerase